MIYALSLNPCLDKTASLPRFCLDAPNRIRVERLDVGGKGVNVARVACALGGQALLMGFDYRGGPVAAAMGREGVPCFLSALKGDLRINMKLRETEGDRTLEINESGAEVTEKDLKTVEEALLSRVRTGDWAALSGSLPPGAPADTYARLCEALNKTGCHTAVDCDGAPLLQALNAPPALIKPNAQEFFALTGVEPKEERAAITACRGLIDRGVGMVCLSQGEGGALIVSAKGAWRCPAAPVKAQGTQGAGDSMLAALMLALSRGEGEGEALRFASAAAGASVARPGTLLCRRADVEALLSALPPAARISEMDANS